MNTKPIKDWALQLPETYAHLQKHKNHDFIIEAVQFISQILRQSGEGVYLSFNGGKDATVVLTLLLLAIIQTGSEHVQINCLNFQQPNPFEEMEEFIELITTALNLKMHTFKTKHYSEELTAFSKMQPLKDILMGSRRDDPGCANLDRISPSDQHKGYPKFERVNPIINWNVNDVWECINLLSIPYCSLYDQGYTSIGNSWNTKKNEKLYDKAKECYKKAFQADAEEERVHRH